MSQLTVLVPLDGSPFSRQIIPVICEKLAPARYKLVVLRVARLPNNLRLPPPDPRPSVIDGVSTLPSSRSQSARELSEHPVYSNQVLEGHRAEVLAQLNEDIIPLQRAGFEVRTVVRYGDPASEIISHAKEIDADLLCLATHGRSGLNRLIMGSVAERILRDLHVPILMIRPVETAAPESMPFAELVST
jgi:nucleotide-binding universal stress UspA family protein